MKNRFFMVVAVIAVLMMVPIIGDMGKGFAQLMENPFFLHTMQMAGGVVAVYVVCVGICFTGGESGEKAGTALIGAGVFLVGPLGIALMLFLLFFMPR